MCRFLLQDVTTVTVYLGICIHLQELKGSYCSEIFECAIYKGITLVRMKTNMEPENHLIEKEIVFQTSILGFHVNFPGCTRIVWELIDFTHEPLDIRPFPSEFLIVYDIQYS